MYGIYFIPFLSPKMFKNIFIMKYNMQRGKKTYVYSLTNGTKAETV